MNLSVSTLAATAGAMRERIVLYDAPPKPDYRSDIRPTHEKYILASCSSEMEPVYDCKPASNQPFYMSLPKYRKRR